MRKIAVLFLLVAIFVGIFAFAGCEQSENANTYTLVAPDGAPALAIANVSGNYTIDGQSYNIRKQVVSSTTIGPQALNSDFAIVPANLAAKMYNEGNDIRLLAVVTNGNLFVMSSIESDTQSLGDMTGKMVYAIGQKSVPDFIFKSLLEKNNIAYAQGEKAVEGQVTIKYCADGSEVIAQLAVAKQAGELAFGVYAEPAVTTSMAKGFVEVFNLQDLWAEQTDSEINGYAQAVLIAKAELCENKELIAKVLSDFEANQSSVVENPAQAVENIQNIYPQTSLKNTMTSQVVQRCNINTLAMPANKSYYEAMLNTLLQMAPDTIKNKLPDDNFYYEG